MNGLIKEKLNNQTLKSSFFFIVFLCLAVLFVEYCFMSNVYAEFLDTNSKLRIWYPDNWEREGSGGRKTLLRQNYTSMECMILTFYSDYLPEEPKELMQHLVEKVLNVKPFIDKLYTKTFNNVPALCGKGTAIDPVRSTVSWMGAVVQEDTTTTFLLCSGTFEDYVRVYSTINKIVESIEPI